MLVCEIIGHTVIFGLSNKRFRLVDLFVDLVIALRFMHYIFIFPHRIAQKSAQTEDLSMLRLLFTTINVHFKLKVATKTTKGEKGLTESQKVV